MTRIRIAHVIHRIGLGGTEYGVLKLVNALDRTRFHTYVFALRGGSPEARSLLRPDVGVHVLDRREGIDWRLPFAMARLMRRERIDIAHSHNWGTYPYTVVAARLAGVRTVIHGLHGRETASDALPPVRRVAEWCLARWTDHFTAVSRELCERARALYRVPPGRIRYCPNGVDLARFDVATDRGALRRALGVPESAPLVASVAGIRPVKDPDTLVRAFALVRAELPAAFLLFVGVDPENRFQRRIALEWPEWEAHRSSIVFAGVRTDVPEILSLIDVYVNSSVYEGMSNTILEAMSSRKPVVATAVGGTPDLIQDGRTGFLVPPGDPKTMADRILRLLRDPGEARRMGDAGRAYVAEHHSFQGAVADMARLYESFRRPTGGPSVPRPA